MYVCMYLYLGTGYCIIIHLIRSYGYPSQVNLRRVISSMAGLKFTYLVRRICYPLITDNPFFSDVQFSHAWLPEGRSWKIVGLGKWRCVKGECLQILNFEKSGQRRMVELPGQIVKLPKRIVQLGLCNLPVELWNLPHGLWNLYCETWHSDCETIK